MRAQRSSGSQRPADLAAPWPVPGKLLPAPCGRGHWWGRALGLLWEIHATTPPGPAKTCREVTLGNRTQRLLRQEGVRGRLRKLQLHVLHASSILLQIKIRLPRKQDQRARKRQRASERNFVPSVPLDSQSKLGSKPSWTRLWEIHNLLSQIACNSWSCLAGQFFIPPQVRS